MAQILTKLVISLAVIVVASEIAKRSTLLGSLIAALPLTSLLVIVWLYAETGSVEKVGALTTNILWLVLASLPFFLLFPFMLKRGFAFLPSFLVALVTMMVVYAATAAALRRAGISWSD